jgi:ABC-type lipoprotein export system ATPase subunit
VDGSRPQLPVGRRFCGILLCRATGFGENAPPMALLELEDLRKGYRTPEGDWCDVLNVARFQLEAGEEVALVGASGSGKTTLLHLIAGILKPDAGTVRLAGEEATRLSEARRDALRARVLGYVFQGAHLLPGLSALENVVLGMSFGPGPDRGRARDLLEHLGLGARLHHRPRELSPGQRQRVALARALANRPRLVLADEPTGNLDGERAREVVTLLRESCQSEGAALLLVSHDPRAIAGIARVERLDENNAAARAGTEADR